MCCTEPLENHIDGKKIRIMIGKIVDAMCNCYQDLSANVLGKSSTINERRFQEFASRLRDFLRAKHCFTEWITLQLLNLSHGQGGKKHMDVSNDPREGHNQTMCFCLHFTDNVGDLWSLKIITGFRKKIGDWLSLPFALLVPLKSALLLHITEITKGYQDILLRQYNGKYAPLALPTWKDQSCMWLDDNMPYDCKIMKVGFHVEVLKMKTSATLSFWLSPALTGAYHLSRFTCIRGMVQLAVMAACQNSFEIYYVVTQEMSKEMSVKPIDDKYPLLAYYCDTCARMFDQDDGGGEAFVGGGKSCVSPCLDIF
jgi:hypothetical protein